MFGLSPLKLYAGLAVILVIASMGAAIKVLNSKLDKARNEVAELVSANYDNQQTIKTQGDALAQWKALAVTPEEAALAVASLTRVKDLSKQMEQALARAKEKDRAKPDCAAWLAADFESMCPTVARGLRDTASRAYKDRGSSGAGGEAAAGRVNEGLRTALPVPAGSSDGRGVN